MKYVVGDVNSFTCFKAYGIKNIPMSNKLAQLRSNVIHLAKGFVINNNP